MTTLARALFLAYAAGADLNAIAGRRIGDLEHVELFAAWLGTAGAPAIVCRRKVGR